MKRFVMAMILMVMIFLPACSGKKDTPTPTPTAGMSAADAAVQLIQQDMYLRLTQQSVENERIETSAKMTATQQVADATATAQVRAENARATQQAGQATERAFNVTVQAGYARDTATAQAAAAESTSTSQAQATGTQQAVVGLTATIQAEATATADYKTQQAPLLFAQQTAVFAQAQSADMAARRERMTNGMIAWGPWVLLIALVGVGIFVTVRKSAFGTVPRDANGMMPGVVIIAGQKKQFISPDRMAGPVITVDNHSVTAPQLVAPDVQEAATRRAQAVEAINALPPQQQNRGMGLMGQTFNPATPRASIEMMDASRVSGWIDEAESKLSEEL